MANENIFTALEPSIQQAADLTRSDEIIEIGQAPEEIFGKVEEAIDAMMRNESVEISRPGDETPETLETPELPEV